MRAGAWMSACGPHVCVRLHAGMNVPLRLQMRLYRHSHAQPSVKLCDYLQGLMQARANICLGDCMPAHLCALVRVRGPAHKDALAHMQDVGQVQMGDSLLSGVGHLLKKYAEY